MSSNETASLLSYYQKNAKEAFEEGFTTQIHFECVESEVYEVHKYYLPVHASKKVKWVRKYFKALDEQPIDITYKRRKHWVEYAETAMMMLGRIYHLCGKGYQVIAGSQFISPVSWAIFGEGNPGCMARYQFSNILEIANHYRNCLHGNCYPIDLHFRVGSHWGPRLAQNFKKQPLNSANFWMTVGLLLTYDIIHECGPDCNEFFELFTNDYRDNSDSFDVIAWEQLRCKILGIPGKVDINRIPQGKVRHREIVGPAAPPRKPFKAKTEVVLISEGYDLLDNETTHPTIIKVDKNSKSHSHDVGYPHGACCPLPPAHSLWPEDVGVGVHGLGIRLNKGTRRFRAGCTPDML